MKAIGKMPTLIVDFHKNIMIFHSSQTVTVYQKVNLHKIPLNPIKPPFSYGFSHGFSHHDLATPQAVTEKYGAPDILVNNAGITKDRIRMDSPGESVVF